NHYTSAFASLCAEFKANIKDLYQTNSVYKSMLENIENDESFFRQYSERADFIIRNSYTNYAARLY
ncbi:MAG TPA: hypothetical protein PLD88_03105, partial [Candidatus Berkiella sp.]|nr:hypothetical protein [Candidatus Berkiella sp.]